MLLLDDDDALPPVPTEGETLLRAALSHADIEAMDRALLESARASWLKVARVVHTAVEAWDLDPWNESCLHLHVRSRRLGHASLHPGGARPKPRCTVLNLWY
jgi:hypothetical protein